MGWYSRWIGAWEQQLADHDQDRLALPFDWGLEWLGLQPDNLAPAQAIARYSREQIARSAEYFATAPPAAPGFELLNGGSLRFPSRFPTPSDPENSTVWAEYFPAPNARGRAVLVIPQWNSDEQGHLSLCRLLQRLGLSSLRLSKAYHHRRKPAAARRADYHVSANLGRTIHATRQSVVDARMCLDWLAARGYDRLGVLGTSLGSCVALLTVAHDERVKAAVYNHVSLNFSDVVWTGVSCRHIRRSLEGRVGQDEMRELWRVISPAAYLERLAASTARRASLLIWAGHDTTFRPEYSRLALDGFSRLKLPHETFYLPCGHYTTGKPPFVWMDGWAMSRFLLRNL